MAQGSGSANCGVSGQLAPGPSKTGAEAKAWGKGGPVFFRFFFFEFNHNGDRFPEILQQV
jgi:hypothetical protein